MTTSQPPLSYRSDSVSGDSPGAPIRRLSHNYSMASIPVGLNDTPKSGPMILSGNVAFSNEISFGEEEPMVVRLSLDKQYWAVGLSRGNIKFYPVNSDKQVPVYSLVAEGETICCTDIAFVPYQDYFPSDKKHIIVTTYASGKVRIWLYTGATPKSRLLKEFEEVKVKNPLEGQKRDSNVKKLNQTMCCSCSPDGLRFVTAGDDCVIRVYDLQKKIEINKCSSTFSPPYMLSHSAGKMDGHVMRICGIQYHPWGDRSPDYSHLFISGGWDDSVQIWDDRYQHSIWQYHGPHICGSDAIDIDPEQNHIVTASWRREKAILQVWKFNDEAVRDFRDGTDSTTKLNYAKPIAMLEQDSSSMPTLGYVARWMGTQYILYGGSNGNMVKIIDRGSLNTAGSVLDIPNGVYSIASYITEPTDRKPHKLAFCAGNKLHVIKIEKK